VRSPAALTGSLRPSCGHPSGSASLRTDLGTRRPRTISTIVLGPAPTSSVSPHGRQESQRASPRRRPQGDHQVSSERGKQPGRNSRPRRGVRPSRARPAPRRRRGEEQDLEQLLHGHRRPKATTVHANTQACESAASTCDDSSIAGRCGQNTQESRVRPRRTDLDVLRRGGRECACHGDSYF
jgi:hypothetical protein